MKPQSRHGTASSGIFECAECSRRTRNSPDETLLRLKDSMDGVAELSRTTSFLDTYLTATPTSVTPAVRWNRYHYDSIDARAAKEEEGHEDDPTQYDDAEFGISMVTRVDVRPGGGGNHIQADHISYTSSSVRDRLRLDQRHATPEQVRLLNRLLVGSTTKEAAELCTTTGEYETPRFIEPLVMLPHTGGRVNNTLDSVARSLQMLPSKVSPAPRQLPFHFIRDLL